MDQNRINSDTIVDREKIRDCLARYCHAIDRRDPELLRTVYWPGAQDDHSVYVGDAEGFSTFAMGVVGTMIHTQHNLGHSLIDVTGDTAVAETQVTAYHRVAIDGVETDIVLGARYLDQMEKRDGEWRISDRVLVNDWVQNFGRSVDWSNGLLGMPLKSEHAIGRSHNDFSETLFRRRSFADGAVAA